MRLRISVLHYVTDYALSIIFKFFLAVKRRGFALWTKNIWFLLWTYKLGNTQIAQWINVPLCPIVLQRNRSPIHRRKYLQHRCVSQF